MEEVGKAVELISKRPNVVGDVLVLQSTILVVLPQVFNEAVHIPSKVPFRDSAFRL